MKKFFKKITALTLSGALLMSSNVAIVEASTSNKLDVYYNGEVLKSDASPFIQKGVTYLPIRSFAEIFDADVSYDNKTEKVTIKSDSEVIMLTVGKKDYTVDGYKYTADAAPVLKSGRVYVPLRVVAEAFNADVSYDKETGNIYVNIDNASDTVETEDLDVDAILKDYFDLSDSQIAQLTEEDINALLQAYNEMNDIGLNGEVIDALTEDMTILMLDIISSQEFTDFIEAVFEIDEFEAVMDEILNSENFKDFLAEITNSEVTVDLVKELYALPEYKAYLEEIKKLPSYKSLVDKYGEEIFSPEFSRDVDIQEQIELSLELIKDPEYIEFTIESMELDSYTAYQDAIYELIYSSDYMTYFEDIASSESLMAFVEEMAMSDNITVLIEKVSTMPELYSLMELYTTKVQELYELYGLEL